MKEHKTKRKSLLICFFVFIVIGIFVVGFWSSISKDKNVEIRYDAAPISKRYPKLESSIDGVVWCSDSFGNTTFGKNSYWLAAFMQLTSPPENIESIHDWQAVEQFTPKFYPAELDTSADWYCSEQFNEQFGGTIMFASKFYYAPDELLLYVYAETS